MEKLSYGKESRIDWPLPYVEKLGLFNKLKLGNLIRRPTVHFRTYTGVAGIIRRRMVVSISVALFSGSFSIMLGFVLYARQLVDLTEAITLIGLLFVIGLLLNGWLILRMMSHPLKNIEYVEDSLVKMVETGIYKPAKSAATEIQSTPLIQSYYAMLEHLDEIETNNLEFLAKVSHEIRSPLASILGYSELLTDANLRHDDQFIDNCYNIIRKEGNQVCRLVEDAVLASGISSGHYNFEFKPTELDQLLELIVEEAAKKSGRKIDYRNHAGNPTVIADAIGLREAINNIIDNGVKFSPSNKPVEVILQETKNPNWVEISVTDHGIGIADRDKPVLFRRFSRIHNAKTNDLPGNGLGLYIANNIIMNHQGEIKVDSKPEVGSTFTIQLPVEYSPN
ncbi:MAG: sensor histidine kinase [Anaerolineales bacterium]